MRKRAYETLATIAVIATATCSQPQIRDCDIDEITSDALLEYTAVIPSNCPVPLGAIGEQKDIGANVIDNNLDFATNYREVKLVVRNSSDQVKGANTSLFKFFNGFGRRAQPKVTFAAATGFSGTITNGQLLPASAKDKGKFEAFKQNSSLGSAARLHVSYIGSVLTAGISGPDVPLANENATWYGSAVGGTSPYTFQWYRNGSLVHTGSAYSANVGTAEFGLRLVVTDQTQSSRWTDYWVDVDGVRATVSGPTLIYYSGGQCHMDGKRPWRIHAVYDRLVFPGRERPNHLPGIGNVADDLSQHAGRVHGVRNDCR